MKILVINTGSSSIKYELFDMDRHRVIAQGLVETDRAGQLVRGHGLAHVLQHEVHDLFFRKIEQVAHATADQLQ